MKYELYPELPIGNIIELNERYSASLKLFLLVHKQNCFPVFLLKIFDINLIWRLQTKCLILKTVSDLFIYSVEL